MNKDKKDLIVESYKNKFSFLLGYDPEIGGELIEANHHNFMSEIMGQDSFNKQPMQRLDEITTDRLLGKHYENGFVILSASRSELSDAENVTRNQKLLNILQSSSNVFSFLPVYGGYIENKGTENEQRVFERSFVILNFDKNGNVGDFDDLMSFSQELSNRFHQETYLIKKPGNAPPYYIRTKSGKVDWEFTGEIKIDDLTQKYFTRLRQLGKQFTFEGVYINPKPMCYSERHCRYLKNEIF